MFQTKICGITRAPDVESAIAAGVDAIGLNFFKKSPRYVTPEDATSLVASFPSHPAIVGVFVNESTKMIREIAEQVPVDFVQLHGDEPAEMLCELSGLSVIRAFRCKDDGVHVVTDFLDECAKLQVQPCAVLVDAYVDGQFGGTGHVVDWSQVEAVRKRISPVPLILAGGITPSNVGEAIEVTRCDAVDTASGVESAPGQKDDELMRDFVSNARKSFLLS